MATVDGGNMIVNALEAEGVSHVFSISGGHIAPIYNALLDSEINLVTTRHEQAAAMMAGGWARCARRTGVCVVTAGPGFTNALTGVADAYMAGAPMVCISGSVPTDMSDRLDLQDLNQLDVIKPITKWARRVITPSRVKEAVHEAFKRARSGPPGPVYLEAPADILETAIEESQVVKSAPLPRPTPGIAPGEAGQVMDMLAASKKPVVVAGSGVWYSNAEPQLERFAETVGAPVFTTSGGKGSMPDDHPLCYGPGLAIRPGAAMAALVGADLIFLVGTRISLFFAHGKIFNPAARLIHLTIDPGELGRNRVPELGLVADAGRALGQLAAAAEGKIKPENYKEWHEELKKAEKSSLEFFQSQLEDKELPMHPLRLCRELDESLAEDDILALDGGDTQIWMNMLRRNRAPGATLESGLFGCLGVGIPFALAAAMAYPDKHIHLLTGDGSVGFNFMELQTALCRCLNVTVVVNNDNAWGMVKHSQMMKYGPERCCGVEIGEVPYHKMLEALGGNAVEVEKIEDVRPQLEKARKRGGVNMLNVHSRPGIVSPGSIALANIGKEGGGY